VLLLALNLFICSCRYSCYTSLCIKLQSLASLRTDLTSLLLLISSIG